MKTRKASFSGSWYPESSAACEKEIKNFLKERDTGHVAGKNLIGGIVPHAGWYFSGSIACNVINCLSQEDQPDTLVIFGMHLRPGSWPRLMNEGAWETPFGPLEIDESLAEELAGQFKFKIETPDNFRQDNTIELQLPFVKYFLKNVKILPIGVPPEKLSVNIAQAAAEISSKLNVKIKVIGSTDLTHYGYNYGFTPKGTGEQAFKWARDENDRKFIDALLAMSPLDVILQGLENQNACCSGAAGAALELSIALGAKKAHSIAYANSHDKHPGDSFVGYTGVVFE